MPGPAQRQTRVLRQVLEAGPVLVGLALDVRLTLRGVRAVVMAVEHAPGVDDPGVRLSGQLHCATAEQVDAVVRHLPEHVALTRAEPGCERFDVVPLDDGLTWQVDEAFASAAAFRAHRARVASSAWGAATAGVERRYSVEGLDG